MSVYALARSETHDFSKKTCNELEFVAGLGIRGDAHAGVHVQHRSRLHIQPPPPNLRQVHLIPIETLRQHGLQAGDIGENVATAGLDLLSLGVGTRLHFLDTSEEQPHAIVVLAGVRNPCPQIDKFQPGLKEKFLVRDSERKIVERLAGVMATVDVGGFVKVGMRIVVEPAETFVKMECV